MWTKSLFPQITPPKASAWPPKYLEAECKTISAPSSKGFWLIGVANVLSTTTKAPTFLAAALKFLMSVILTVGFVGVSKYKTLQPLVISLNICSWSLVSQRQTSILRGGKNSLKITLVPP